MSVPGSWNVVLDPTAIASGPPANRTQLNLNSGAIQIDQKGIDWGDAQIEQYRADFRFGSYRVDYRVPNRKVQIPLFLSDDAASSVTEELARQRLREKVGQIQVEGGWILRQRIGGPAMYGDIVDAFLTLPDTWGETGGVENEIHLLLELIPDFYGEEIVLDTVTVGSSGVISGPLKSSGVNAIIEGDWGGRSEILVTDTSGHPKNGILWGYRARYYDGATTALLTYEAESLTPIAPASVQSLSGASGGQAVTDSSLTKSWTPLLGTDVSGSGAMTHRGSYRVRARVLQAFPSHLGGANVWLRFLWGVGASVGVVTNDVVLVPGGSGSSDQFYIVDLGEIRIDQAPTGSHRWEGQIQARGQFGGEGISIDQLYLVPLDDTGGYVISNSASTALESAFASDAFNEAPGTQIASPVAPTATLSFTGGSLGPGQWGYVATALNAYGETLPGPQAVFTINQLATPAVPTLALDTSGGSLPAGTYGYRVVAKDAAGGATLPSVEATITTGSTGRIRVNWSAIVNADTYDVYGRTSGGELFIANTTQLSWVDDGSITPSGALPVSNTTAQHCRLTLQVTPVTGANAYGIYGRSSTLASDLHLITLTAGVTTWIDDNSVIASGAKPTSNTTASADLNAKVSSSGDAWSSAGATTDFYIDSINHVAVRTAGIDTAYGRFALLGPSSLDTDTSVDVGLTTLTWVQQWFGVLARYSDGDHWVAAAITGYNVDENVSPALVLIINDGGSPQVVASASLGSVPFLPSYNTVRLVINSVRAQVYLMSRSSSPLIDIDDARLDTGGLPAGRSGILDYNPTLGVGFVNRIITRQYDNFITSPASADAVIFGHSNAALRYDGMFRADPSGAYYGPIAVTVGDLPRIPPSGLEQRPVELFLRPSRGDFTSLTDAALDSYTVQVKYRPSYLHRP